MRAFLLSWFVICLSYCRHRFESLWGLHLYHTNDREIHPILKAIFHKLTWLTNYQIMILKKVSQKSNCYPVLFYLFCIILIPCTDAYNCLTQILKLTMHVIALMFSAYLHPTPFTIHTVLVLLNALWCSWKPLTTSVNVCGALIIVKMCNSNTRGVKLTGNSLVFTKDINQLRNQ